MDINDKPEVGRIVKVYFFHKVTKVLVRHYGKWNGEMWLMKTPLGFCPVPQHLEVVGWEEN